MFIDMDEDDKNENNVNINEMFKRDDPKLQFYVDVSSQNLINQNINENNVSNTFELSYLKI